MGKRSVLGFAAALGALGACGGGTDGAGEASVVPEAGAPTAGYLVKTTATTGDAKCAAGGVRIDYGADKNQNGQLDDAEITGSESICKPVGATSTLTTASATGASATCPAGATTVKSGPDTNGNGVLDDSEVTQTNEICAGGFSATLSVSTAIAAGDPSCPMGGTQTQTGTDNGANGGLAGDGVLQLGEIRQTTTACAALAAGIPVASFAAPAGPVGTSKILTSGGAGSAGAGGVSGAVLVSYASAASLGNHIRVFKTGLVDPSFVIPPDNVAFGGNKLDVVTDTAIPAYTSETLAMDGEYFTIVSGGNNSGLYYRLNQFNPKIAVSGVHVAAGKKLVFPVAITTFTITDDFHNEGTITAATDPTTGNRGSVAITSSKFIGAPGSSVVLTGAPIAGAAGGAGGAFTAKADHVFNHGPVDTSGADGDAAGAFAGGAGGTVILTASRTASSGAVMNMATIRTAGGAGKGVGGNGGAGGNVSITTGRRGVDHDGNVDTSGGNGAAGGKGGNFTADTLNASSVASTRVRGNITQKGGDEDDTLCATSCAGGIGGTFSARARGGDVIVAGDLVGGGGKSKGMTGAAGATVTINSNDIIDPETGAQLSAGPVRVSGTIDHRGGAGTVGGAGGNVTIQIVTANSTAAQEIDLFGYDAIDTTGADGTTGGANGGAITIAQQNAASGTRPGGDTVVQADLKTHGGSALVSGIGGGGGAVVLRSNNIFTTPVAGSQVLYVTGNVDTSSGSGFTGAGAPGIVTCEARERIDLKGTITQVGGVASAAAGTSLGAQTWKSAGPLTIGGAISIAGGSSGSAAGGACGLFSIFGNTVVATAPITAKGGNGATTGGAAAGIALSSTVGHSTYTTLSALGGTGTTNGTSGVVTVDGNTL